MNPGAVELQEIQVDNFGQNNRCECWAHNIADQFPIKSIKEQSGDTIIEVGLPQEGYSIETTVIDREITGKSNIVLNDKIKSIKYDEFKCFNCEFHISILLGTSYCVDHHFTIVYIISMLYHIALWFGMY